MRMMMHIIRFPKDSLRCAAHASFPKIHVRGQRVSGRVRMVVPLVQAGCCISPLMRGGGRAFARRRHKSSLPSSGQRCVALAPIQFTLATSRYAMEEIASHAQRLRCGTCQTRVATRAKKRRMRLSLDTTLSVELAPLSRFRLDFKTMGHWFGGSSLATWWSPDLYPA